ncbi:MAG: hypothetical protein IPK76_11640 [Lewinellaceae bacterium]|nr:hypothetical protein [Lewinellaceae bacterium]
MKYMIEQIINRYIEDLRRLRENEGELERYEFKLSLDGTKDENQLNRQRIGVGLLNDLKIPDDYDIVKRLIKEETRHRLSSTENYEHEVIYLYYYLLSQFGVIEDIWDFAKLKFDGTMDADSGFETGFFLTYGKERLKKILQDSPNKLSNKIYKNIFVEETAFSDDDGQGYKEQQKSYFGLVLPLKDAPSNYLWIREKEGFKESFRKWKESTDLSNEWNAYEYIRFSEYLGDEIEIEKAMVNLVNVSPKSWSAEKYRTQLSRKRIRLAIQKIRNLFKIG